MSEELNLVRDLAVILVSAGAFTIISRALRQPLILGYILAGFLIGPNVDFFPGITSNEAVEQWSEIGIIFLMFGLGLEFSFKRLLKVGSTALVTAGTKFLGVFLLGFVVGQALSWTLMESIFLGGLLSMSSTTVVIKSYDDMGLKDKPFAGMVFGTLVVEDLIAILLMVLFPTIALSSDFAGSELLFNFAKLFFFIILWFLVGIYLIPSILKKASRFINDEILLVVSVGLCLGMVSLASAVGFSTALGAFVMGSILAETIESEHILKLVGPIKDLFGSIFFVSVGMMVSPAVIGEHWLTILILTIVVMASHIIFSAAGVLLTGKGLKNAVFTGFSLAQLGEFGFILAGVGCSLSVMRDFIYPVIIAVSVITTFTTPYMIRLAGPAFSLLERKLPANWLVKIHQSEQSGSRSDAEQSEWRRLIRLYLLRILLYSVIIIAVSIAFRLYVGPFADRVLASWAGFPRNLAICAVQLISLAPFIYGMSINSGSINSSALKLIRESRVNRWPVFGLVLLRSFIAIGIVLAVISSRFELAGWTVALIIIFGLIFIYIARSHLKHYTLLEKRFLTNLNQKEAEAVRRAPVASSVRKRLAGYDVHIEPLVVSADSDFVGKHLSDLPIRSESGANIIKISRGTRNIIIPSARELIYPADTILAVGTSAQIGKLKAMMAQSSEIGGSPREDKEFDVVSTTLNEASYLCGKVLKDTNMRESHCMVISVLRSDEFITNPRPDFRFEAGDVVWIAGEKDSCKWFV